MSTNQAEYERVNAPRLSFYKAGILGNVDTDFFKNTSKQVALVLEQVCVYLHTDATVANRYVCLYVYDKDNIITGKTSTYAQSASTNEHHTFSDSIGARYAGIVGSAQSPIPKTLILPFEYCKLQIGSGVAGDTYDLKAVARVVRFKRNS